MILADTSAWIEVLRGRRRESFRSFAASDEIVTCLPVIQEVLQGLGDPLAYGLAREGFAEVRVLEDPLQRIVFDEAVELFRSARRAGVTVRSSVDCLIAACAIRNHATVLHVDRDFVNLARVSRLQQAPL